MNIRIGVIQGGILSPKLFNIFYDTLINRIDNLKYFIIAYSDIVKIAVIYETYIKKFEIKTMNVLRISTWNSTKISK